MCLGYDILPATVHNVNAGKVPFAGLGQWLGFSTEPLVKNGLMRGTNHVAEIISGCAVLFFAGALTRSTSTATTLIAFHFWR